MEGCLCPWCLLTEPTFLLPVYGACRLAHTHPSPNANPPIHENTHAHTHTPRSCTQVNRGSSTGNVTVEWTMLEVPGIGANTPACVTELYSNETHSAVGSITLALPTHDMAVLRVSFGAPCS